MSLPAALVEGDKKWSAALLIKPPRDSQKTCSHRLMGLGPFFRSLDVAAGDILRLQNSSSGCVRVAVQKAGSPVGDNGGRGRGAARSGSQA